MKDKIVIPLKITMETLIGALNRTGLDYMHRRNHSASFIVQTCIFLHINTGPGYTQFETLLKPNILNLFLLDFLKHYCTAAGDVDWDKLIRLIKEKEQKGKHEGSKHKDTRDRSNDRPGVKNGNRAKN